MVVYLPIDTPQMPSLSRYGVASSRKASSDSVNVSKVVVAIVSLFGLLLRWSLNLGLSLRQRGLTLSSTATLSMQG